MHIPASLDFLRQFPTDRVRLAGSALDRPDARDVDVFTDHPGVFARLLRADPALGLHPVLLDPEVTPVTELHHRMSWSQCCATLDATGLRYTGRSHTRSNVLRFNPESVRQFTSARVVLEAATKLVERGCRLPFEERMRVWTVLGENDDALLRIMGRLAESRLSPNVLLHLREAGAVVAGGVFRDMLMGREPKDIDVFVPGAPEAWERLCSALAADGCEEIPIDRPGGGRVNLRKYRDPATGSELDVIQYGFVQRPEHVVETFDFRLNALWRDPATGAVRGPSDGGAREAVEDVRRKRLVVGSNLWFRAGLARSLKRWERFTRDGFVADEKNKTKYREYVALMAPAH